MKNVVRLIQDVHELAYAQRVGDSPQALGFGTLLCAWMHMGCLLVNASPNSVPNCVVELPVPA
jgi:hypothetical protein